MTRKRALAKSVESFRNRAESFMTLARQLELSKYKDAESQRARLLLLADAQRTVALVRATMQRADDLRTWAHDVFGETVDSAPVATFASRVLERTLNATMGYQSYRMRKFLKSGTLERAPQVGGTMIAASVANLLNEIVQ